MRLVDRLAHSVSRLFTQQPFACSEFHGKKTQERQSNDSCADIGYRHESRRFGNTTADESTSSNADIENTRI